MCTVVARQVPIGLFRRLGINPPECGGRAEGCYDNLLERLGWRNINWKGSVIEF